MKIVLSLIFTLISINAFAADSTELLCEMKREEYKSMSFEFRFLTPKRALANFHFQKGHKEGTQTVPVSAIHNSSEARYVGLNFLEEEKLVFIFLSTIFAPENLGIPMDIEVVSSIYGPTNIKCRAIK
jgi:hypothetical protein